MSTNLRRTVDQYPTNPAVISVAQNKKLTYEQFLKEVEATACSLLALGVQRQDRVAVWSSNCLEWTVLQHATAMIGSVQVSLNPALRDAELIHALNSSGARVIIHSEEFKGESQIEVLRRARLLVPSLRAIVVLGNDAPSGWLRWDDFRSAGQGAATNSAVHTRERSLTPSDPVNIQFTSGTTGLPKAATLTHENIVNNGYFIGHLLSYSPKDKVCIPVPLFHCFGQVLGNLACSTHGATMVYPGPTYDAAATLRAVHDERCTSLYGVPSQFIAELQQPSFNEYDLTSLRTGIMAGAPCPVEVMRKVRENMHMDEVAICFGMTETSPVSFQTRKYDPEEKRVCTVGTVHPHVEACVVDPDTEECVERGVPGELWVRGYSVMSGYWNNPIATSSTINDQGWCRTGDLAVLDDDGYCKIVGRLKDVVIRGGENLYPREIEDFLHENPDVIDVQVFGVPDVRMGEQLCAWVKLRHGTGASTTAVRQWCVGKISKHKIPKYWKEVNNEFPTTVSGKPQKYVMRKMAMEELGLGEPVMSGAEAGCG